MPIKGTYYNATLGAAPSTTSHLGYNIPTQSPVFSGTITSGNTGAVYAPATGSSSNYLTPGVYTISVYAFTFFNGTVTSASVNLSIGIISSATITPSGTTSLFNTNTAPEIRTVSTNTNTYFPTYTFTVTTANYYYVMNSVSSVTLTGTSPGITLGIQLFGLSRIA